MRPPVILEPSTTYSSNSSSYSPSSDRRLNTIAKHFVNHVQMDSHNISPSPTASSDSVFAQIVRAPEDAILGVYIILFLFQHH